MQTNYQLMICKGKLTQPLRAPMTNSICALMKSRKKAPMSIHGNHRLDMGKGWESRCKESADSLKTDTMES